jgi:hypothetical protein
MRFIAVILAVLVMAAIAAFCLFGFLAANELSDPARRLAWQVGYAGAGCACLAGIMFLFVRGGDRE